MPPARSPLRPLAVRIGSSRESDSVETVENPKVIRLEGLPKRFDARTLRAIHATKYLRIRCGGTHRFIAIWVVVVKDRVLVRSWNNDAGGWFRAFADEPEGAIQLDGRDVLIRGVPVRAAGLSEAANAAYAAKYITKANEGYVKGFAAARRMAATLELVPR